MLFMRLEILYLSQSGLFSWQVPGCLPHKSLNIGCYIKEVTNQADGERCHRVSILQGRCLSLREPTPSALTSNNPAHTRSTSTCSRAHKNTSMHRYSSHVNIPILTQTRVCIRAQFHTHICVCLYMHKHTVCMHANPAIHISLGINVKDDSVQ